MKFVLAERKKGDKIGYRVFRRENCGREGVRLSWVPKYVGVVE